MQKATVPVIITFKTKVRKIQEGDGSVSDYIDFKRVVDRHDCNLRPHQHPYFNSDLFRSILNGAYKAAINNKEWCRLKDLPDTVTVDTTKFLAVVSVQVDC